MPKEPSKALVSAVDRVKVLKEEIGILDEKLSKLKAEHKELVEETIPVALYHMGVVQKDHRGSLTLKSGESVYLSPDCYVYTVKSDTELLHAWLRENGHEDMVVQYVFPNSLKAHIKSMLDEGRENDIPEFVKIHKFTKAVLKKPLSRKSAKNAD